ncbi:hypothetical protein HPB49_010212 [Dermacentor silvarum]|uniref:Uncharacterized protein n=1 Tax=Dermacentor silvarum TaxID=543639 RepID=A0ACB8D4M1_DERSI|nr:hypothetical protein HPB49_010212 [Dermacentor silvarum]
MKRNAIQPSTLTMSELSDGESGFASSGTPGRSRNMEALLRATPRPLTHDLHPPALPSASQKVGTVGKRMRAGKHLRPSPRRMGAPTPATARKRKRRKVAAAPRDVASPPTTSQSRPSLREAETTTGLPQHAERVSPPPPAQHEQPDTLGDGAADEKSPHTSTLYSPPLSSASTSPSESSSSPTPSTESTPSSEDTSSPACTRSPSPSDREAPELSEGEELVQQVHHVDHALAEVEEPAAQPPSHHGAPKLPEGETPVERQQLSEHVAHKLPAREKSPQRLPPPRRARLTRLYRREGNRSDSCLPGGKGAPQLCAWYPRPPGRGCVPPSTPSRQAAPPPPWHRGKPATGKEGERQPAEGVSSGSNEAAQRPGRHTCTQRCPAPSSDAKPRAPPPRRPSTASSPRPSPSAFLPISRHQATVLVRATGQRTTQGPQQLAVSRVPSRVQPGRSFSDAAGDRPARLPVEGNTSTPPPRSPPASPDSRDAVIALLTTALAFASEFLPQDCPALPVCATALAAQRTLASHGMGTYLPVRAVVYADDVALFVRGPPAAMARMRVQLQAAEDAVGDFLRAIGLRLSAAKSEAIMVHPRAAARRHTGCVVVDGVPLPWRLTVRYLGLTIDHRLTWFPAVKRLRVVTAAPPLALSMVLYALPLCNLRPHLWRRIDGDHRRVLRMYHGLPSASRVAETLAETGAWPVSLTADLRALRHLERLSRAPGAGPMLSYLRELPKSRV